MSDLPPSAPSSQNGAAAMGGPVPLTLNLQYTKDLSFEVPGAPEIFSSLREQPRVDIGLDVNARRLQEGQDTFEVALQIRCDAKGPNNETIFIAELVYCGIFSVNIDPSMLEPLLLVECPRLLFPFARNILADVTREGAFPPVMLQPIDFVALWQSRRGEAGAQTIGTETIGNA